MEPPSGRQPVAGAEAVTRPDHRLVGSLSEARNKSLRSSFPTAAAATGLRRSTTATLAPCHRERTARPNFQVTSVWVTDAATGDRVMLLLRVALETISSKRFRNHQDTAL